jgi:TetR/AcrR family transcriptional repressor of nem operon
MYLQVHSLATLVLMVQTEPDPVVAGAATAKGRATRSRIVDAASGLVFEQGVAVTTLDQVGEAAGVGKSQLYHYFANKAALVRAVIERQTAMVLAAQQPLLSSLDSWEGWQRWRDGIVEMQRRAGCRGGCPIGSLASELADSDGEARLALADGFDRWAALLRGGIVSLQEHGLIRTDADVASLSVATLASLQGGLLLCQAQHDVAPLEMALDAALAHLRSWASQPS